MATKTKQDLIKSIAKNTGLKYSIAALAVDAFLDEIQTTFINGDRLELRKIGVFTTVQLSEKKIRSVNSGEEMIIPSKKKIKFTASKILSRKVNENK